MKKTIWAQTLVKNEGRFIWFAVKSVIDFVDKIIIWDTGSSDDTVKIIKLLQQEYPKKIEFKEIGEVDANGIKKARQQMLDATLSNWFLLLDGDEVWWESSIRQIKELIDKRGEEIELIVNPFYSVIGDIYHYQEEIAGRYNLLGRTGHLSVRAVNRKIPGLHIEKPYGQEGFFDSDKKAIQDRDQKRMVYLNAPYMHFSNIIRSDLKEADEKVIQRKRKIRFEIGNKFPKKFKYPEVFYLPKPEFIADHWQKMSAGFRLRATIETPLRKIKRRII